MEINPYSMLEVTLAENDVGDDNDVIFDSVIQPEVPLSTDTQVVIADMKTCINQNYEKLSYVTVEESEFRYKLFKNTSQVLKFHLHCTICDVHIGCVSTMVIDDITHPLLKVLTCSSCTQLYRYVDFPLGTTERDIRCRWCTVLASERSLIFCVNCPFAFCEKCVEKHFKKKLSSLDPNKNWKCFACNMSSLWRTRAIVWGLATHMAKLRQNFFGWIGDISRCCRSSTLKMKNNSENLKIESVTKKAKFTYTTAVNNQTNGHNNLACNNNNIEPLDKLIVETAWIKQKFNLISIILQQMDDFVQYSANGMTSFAKASFAKSEIENLSTMIRMRVNELKLTCETLVTDFSKKMEEARTSINESSLQTTNNQQQIQTYVPQEIIASSLQQQVPIQQPQMQLAIVSTKSTIEVPSFLNSILTSNPQQLTTNKQLVNVHNNFILDTSNQNLVHKSNKLSESINNSFLNVFTKNKQKKIIQIPNRTGKKMSTVKRTKSPVKKSPVKRKNVEVNEEDKSPNHNGDIKFNDLPIKQCYVRLVRLKNYEELISGVNLKNIENGL